MRIDDLILDYPKDPPIPLSDEARLSFDVNNKAQVYELIQELLPDICGNQADCGSAAGTLKTAWLIELILESNYGSNEEVSYRESAKQFVLNNYARVRERQERFAKAAQGLNG